MKRYSNAKEPSPKVIYIDCDREGGSVKVKDLPGYMALHEMPCFGLQHKIPSIAYVFLGHLSQCIFQWSNEDEELLKHVN